jgi:excisionase family DNA binding protein
MTPDQAGQPLSPRQDLPRPASCSLERAAQLLGVTKRTIYNRIRSGRLQTIRTINGSQRVLRESF